MAKEELKNIFLSASIPVAERDPKYIDSADIIAIRDAIIALVDIALPRFRLIWGGHPSITPLVYEVVHKREKEGENLIQNHVRLYQSRFFEKKFPPDNNKFENIVFTEAQHDTSFSVNHMRKRMLNDNEYAAGVFIGGMEGVEEEFIMFRESHPHAIFLPIASTGAAANIIYDNLLSEELKNERYLLDYAYTSVFQDLLFDQI